MTTVPTNSAMLRGQKDRRLNLRYRDQCPFSNKNRAAAWIAGWEMVDKLLKDEDDPRSLSTPEPKA